MYLCQAGASADKYEFDIIRSIVNNFYVVEFLFQSHYNYILTKCSSIFKIDPRVSCTGKHILSTILSQLILFFLR